MQSVSSRIWTRVAMSISYDDNEYTTGTSFLFKTHELFYLRSHRCWCFYCYLQIMQKKEFGLTRCVFARSAWSSVQFASVLISTWYPCAYCLFFGYFEISIYHTNSDYPANYQKDMFQKSRGNTIVHRLLQGIWFYIQKMVLIILAYGLLQKLLTL